MNQLQQYQQNYGEAYAQTLPTVGDAMAQILKFFGVDVVYGVGGDFAANIITALQRSLEIVPSSNEMHAGFCGCGDAEINGISAVLTTYTVGSLPCTSAAALAKSEKLPVIFISGAPAETEINQFNIHHTVANASDWSTDYDSALNSFAALGIKAERLQGARNPRQANVAAERFLQLVKHAYVHKEPVFIEVPRDVVNSLTQAIQLPASLAVLNDSFFALSGCELITQHIIEKLSHAKAPMVYLGENSKLNHQLIELVMQFCQKLQIPFATSWLAKGIVDEHHPLSLGSYNGVFSAPEQVAYIEHTVDYVLDIDSSVSVSDIGNGFNTGTHRIDNFDNKTVLKGVVPNQQGLIHVMQALLDAELAPFQYDAPVKSEPQLTAKQSLGFDVIAAACNQIQQSIEPALVYVPEVGNSFFASFGLTPKLSSLGRSWITNPWYGAMGTSLPYARAAARRLKQQASKDRVVVITGDGGFHFQLNELIHFQREQLDVTIIYMRNDIFHLGKSSESDIYNCSTGQFDVCKLVEAYGGSGSRATTKGELESEFKRALQLAGIRLIEVPVSTAPERQCREIKLLNLYIKKQNGDPQALREWAALTDGETISEPAPR